MLKMAEISSGKSPASQGNQIRIHFTAPEAEKDLWKCCGWERVNLIDVLTNTTPSPPPKFYFTALFYFLEQVWEQG